MRIVNLFFAFGIYLSLSFFGSPASAVTLDQLTTTDKIDDFSMKPVGSTSVFSVSSPEIWATGYLSGAPKGTVVSVEWMFREEKGDSITTLAQNETQADGSRYIAFRLAPNQGQAFPVGRYQALFKIDRKEAGFVNFQVIALNKAAGTETAGVQFMNYKDKLGRFSIDLPGTWFPAETANPSMAILVGMNMQDEPLAKIAVSVLDANLKEGYTAQDAVMAMRDRLVQESKDANAALLVDQPIPDSGEAVARVLSFSYTSPNGKAVEDRKMILCVKNHVYVLTFINEKKLSSDMKMISEHVINSFVAF